MTTNGKLYGCGKGDKGELGVVLNQLNRKVDFVKEFFHIESLSSVNVSNVFAGGPHSFV